MNSVSAALLAAPVHAYFYALQPSHFTWDRYFKVYFLEDGIAGACIARQVYDLESGYNQLIGPAGLFGGLLKGWVNRLVRQRYEREAFYDALEPASREFVRADSRNFLLDRLEVRQVAVQSRRALWTGMASNCGALSIQTRRGRKRLILTGQQDLEQITSGLIASLSEDKITIQPIGD